MENRNDFGRRIVLLWIILSLFVLFRCTKAENKVDPTDNLNLAPFWAWRSAHWCIKDKLSGSCPAKYVLTEDGVLNVDPSDAKEFCAPGGCADKTRAVLSCIHHLKRHYWFANKKTLNDLNTTINNLCPSPPSG